MSFFSKKFGKSEDNTSGGLPADVSIEDIKRVLKITDSLLGDLPKEEIESFSKSQDFELYKKVLHKIVPEAGLKSDDVHDYKPQHIDELEQRVGQRVQQTPQPVAQPSPQPAPQPAAGSAPPSPEPSAPAESHEPNAWMKETGDETPTLQSTPASKEAPKNTAKPTPKKATSKTDRSQKQEPAEPAAAPKRSGSSPNMASIKAAIEAKLKGAK